MLGGSSAQATTSLKCPLLISCPTITLPGPTVTLPRRTITVTPPPRTVTVYRYKTLVRHSTATKTLIQRVPGPTVTHNMVQTTTHNVVQPQSTATVVGPTQTKTVTQKGAQRHKSAGVKTVTQTTTTTKTKIHESVVTLTKTQAAAYSAGLTIGGVAIVLLVLWLAYILGYKTSDHEEKKELRGFIDQIRRR